MKYTIIIISCIGLILFFSTHLYSFITVDKYSIHIIKPGETLSEIAIKYYGSDSLNTMVTILQDKNSIKDPGLIKSGSKLLIPIWEDMLCSREIKVHEVIIKNHVFPIRRYKPTIYQMFSVEGKIEKKTTDELLATNRSFRLIDIIDYYVRMRFKSNIYPIEKKGYKLKYLIRGVKNEILKGKNLWEKIEMEFIIFNINTFILHLDATYSSGLGDTEPAFSNYKDMQRKYHEEIQIYVHMLRSEIKDYIEKYE